MEVHSCTYLVSTVLVARPLGSCDTLGDLSYAELIAGEVAKDKKAAEVIHAITRGFSGLLMTNAVWSSARHPPLHTPTDKAPNDDSDANNQGAVNNGDVGDDEGGVDDQDDMDDQGVGSSP